MQNNIIKNRRYELIIELLQLKRANFLEIENYLQKKDKTIKLSRRTFQRYIKDIEENYNLIIKADRKLQVYYIHEDSKKSRKAIETYNILTLLNFGKKYDFIKTEKHNSVGTKFIPQIINAIENKFVVEINYYEYWDIKREIFRIKPVALKEFKRRWYLIAIDTKEDVKKSIKNFELSRIDKLEVTTEEFETKNFDIDEHYSEYYGIRTDNDPEANTLENITLKVEQLHAKYIKAVPIHKSQVILNENEKEKEIFIKLKLRLTFDFIQELLSYGSKIKVLEPPKLQKLLKEEYEKTLNQYK